MISFLSFLQALRWYDYYCRFADGKTEAQDGEMHCPRSLVPQIRTDANFNPASLCLLSTKAKERLLVSKRKQSLRFSPGSLGSTKQELVLFKKS